MGADNKIKIKTVDGIVFKYCTYCKEYLTLDSFNKDSSQTTGKSSKCRKCNKAYNEMWRINNPWKSRLVARNTYLKREYNISLQEYIELLKKQNYKCIICGGILKENAELRENKSAHNLTCIDHCHKTGKVRGILCKHCNCGLGYFKDNIDIIKSAIKYLEDNK